MEKIGKIKVLFRGWFLQHSYGIVNCFQLLHLVKNHSDKIDFYVQEMPYYREEWKSVKKMVFGEKNNEILESIPVWKGEKVDLVYSITYRYDIENVNIGGQSIPKCVFYTSEFSKLNKDYFCVGKLGFGEEDVLRQYLSMYPDICFTSPSNWSSQGIKGYGIEDKRNRVITHGVDTNIFKDKAEQRQILREFYKVNKDDILMLNIGAMTQNKGIMLILMALHELVNNQNKKEYKLLLKGTGDLYSSKTFLETYFEQFQKEGKMTKNDINVLLEKHIIFSDKTLSFERINDLYNAADVYISPYLAEGFNLVPLEALAAGLPVIVPETGSTMEYISDLYNNGGEKLINYVKSRVQEYQNGLKQNEIDVKDLIHTIKNVTMCRSDILKGYIKEKYSWDTVSNLLMDYFSDIVDGKVFK